MKCFNHQETDAVAICKNCNKALCKDCAAELENGIACKNQCEKAVEEINELVGRSKDSYKMANTSFLTASNSYQKLAIWQVLVGIAFIIAGVLFKQNLFLIILGIIFFIGAVSCYSTSRKYAKIQYPREKD